MWPGMAMVAVQRWGGGVIRHVERNVSWFFEKTEYGKVGVVRNEMIG